MIEFNLVNFKHSTGIVALNNIDVNIKSGELVALIGENGAGKTTFVKHINGLLKPTSGNVKIFGSNTKDTSVAKLSRKVGIVFQNPDNQLFSETVEDEIRFGLNNFIKDASEVEKRVKLMLNYFDLYKYKSQSPMLLSGGEKKRLCLAIVQAWNPEILILDEPTVGQDFINKEKLKTLISKLNKDNKTVIIVSHDIEFLWSLQPRTIVMYKGQILEDDTCLNIFNKSDIIRKYQILPPKLLELSKSLDLKSEITPEKLSKSILLKFKGK